MASGYTPVVAAVIGTGFVDSVSALAVDAGGGILVPMNSQGTRPQIMRVTGSASAGFVTKTVPGTSVATRALAVDGAGNIWQAPETTEQIGGVAYGFVTETTTDGTSLLGSGGIARPATSTTTSTTLVQNMPVLGPSNGIAVDLAGNVWVSNDNANLFSVSDGPLYGVTGLVGVAVPVTPTSVGLVDGTLGLKP